MKLRQLEAKDAYGMLEWMHDNNVSSHLGKDFDGMTIENCLNFIKSSVENPGNDRHYAITDEQDEYMGTISLKNIEWDEGRAEYAIACRTKAIGRGFAKAATEALFQTASQELNLNLLYLYVRAGNVRAQKLYLKTGFVLSAQPDFIHENVEADMLWFVKALK